METKEIFLQKSTSKRSFRYRIHSLKEEALTSFTVAYLTHIASLRVRHSYLGQKVGHS